MIVNETEAIFLSIVLPLYNEENTIEKTITECVEKVCRRFKKSEIIVVDDASTDNSANILSNLESRLEQLVVLRNLENSGHGRSLQRGLTRCKGDLVFTIDSDYQHDPAEFWKLYPLWDASTIVTGLRTSRKDSLFRRAVSTAANRVINVINRDQIRDINIPFKIFPGPALHRLLATLPPDCLVPSALMMIGASSRELRIVQIPVDHLPRDHGRSKLIGYRFILFSIRAGLEIIRYKSSLSDKSSR